ncbi:MAG TPA: GTPase [archaeon]|nr:GTPase [archaeon]
MPINASAEFFIAQDKYNKARTREERIEALEEMIRFAPRHKGGEALRAQLNSRLAKLKESKGGKAAFKKTSISKEGDVQVCIVGLTQSGKSTLLSELTNAKPNISDRPFTTTKPEVGIAEWEGVKFQAIEIPSMFRSIDFSIMRSSDIIIIVARNKADKEQVLQLLDANRVKKPSVVYGEGKLFDNIWKELSLIRVYTKEPGKTVEKRALVLKDNATVRVAAEKIHKDFLKFFKFARVWGKSVSHRGEKVGLGHRLDDKDVVEFHLSS